MLLWGPFYADHAPHGFCAWCACFQMRCVDGIPEIHVEMDMGRNVTDEAFTCMMAGNCKSAADPLYWTCVHSANDFKFPAFDCLGFDQNSTSTGMDSGVQPEFTQASDNDPRFDSESVMETSSGNSCIQSLLCWVRVCAALLVFVLVQQF